MQRPRFRIPRFRKPASRPRASQTVVCREGWYYVVLSCLVFGAAMLREVNLMLILGGMLFGPLVFNWRLTAVTLRGLRLRRTMPKCVCAGDLLVVNLELTNTRRRIGSWAIRVNERIWREGNGRVEADTGKSCINAVTTSEGMKAFAADENRVNAVTTSEGVNAVDVDERGDGVGADKRGDAVAADGRVIETCEYFSYVPAGEKTVRGYRGRLPQRGRYRWDPARVATRFPFGLFEREVLMGSSQSLLVFPRLGRLTQAWAKRRHASLGEAHGRERRHCRVSGDLYGVREWQHGDSLRWIHWRSTARHGDLVVRQFEQHRSRDMAILLDLWQPEEPTTAHLENVELAVSFAATVMADVCRKGGCDVLFGTASEAPEFVAGMASTMLFEDTMTELALAEAASGDHLPRLLEQALTRIDRGTEVVVISTRRVDLDDDRRFGPLWQDPQLCSWARQIRVVTTDNGDLDRYFRAEGLGGRS